MLFKKSSVVDSTINPESSNLVTTSQKFALWTGGRVPYAVEPGFPWIEGIKWAKKELKRTQKVRLEPKKPTDSSYILFSNEAPASPTACASSYVGRIGGKQKISRIEYN